MVTDVAKMLDHAAYTIKVAGFYHLLSIRFGKVIIVKLLLPGVKVDVQRNLVHARQLLL